jgi:hypothetical protein
VFDELMLRLKGKLLKGNNTIEWKVAKQKTLLTGSRPIGFIFNC